MFLDTYRFGFCQRGLNGKLYTFIGALNEKVIHLHPCNKTVTVRKFPKIPLVVIYPNIHYHPSRWLQVWLSSSVSQSINLHSDEKSFHKFFGYFFEEKADKKRRCFYHRFLSVFTIILFFKNTLDSFHQDLSRTISVCGKKIRLKCRLGCSSNLISGNLNAEKWTMVSELSWDTISFLLNGRHEFLHHGLKRKTFKKIVLRNIDSVLAFEFWFFEKTRNLFLFLLFFVYLTHCSP